MLINDTLRKGLEQKMQLGWIDFSKADADERDFVIRMTEKRCEQKHA